MRKILSFCLALLCIAFVFCISGCNSSSTSDYIEEKPITPYSASECIGKTYSDVASAFSKTGFLNVTKEYVYDLELYETEKDSTVKSISINGITDFAGNMEFNKLSNVIIICHSIKKINAPTSSNEANEIDASLLLEKFKNAGFTNVSITEKLDLDPDKTDKLFENEIIIGGKSSFSTQDQFQHTEEVKIITHKPFQKHKVKVIIDFVPNLLFNRYSVVVELGDKKINLGHGEDAEFECSLKSDFYYVKVYSKTEPSIKGSLKIQVNGETEAAYKITCYSEEIDITEQYIINKGEIGANEAIIPISSSNCKYKNYRDIEQHFIQAGFSNISTKILYDIYWGLTAEGEVDSVSVDGNTKFEMGDIFNKSAPIVITYHMKEEDDPSRPVVTAQPAVTTKAPSETTPQPLYYSTNTRESAKNGNTGVFSYRDRGSSYDIYWIIDFDEGYVYYFTEGNGESSCDRVKIVSGTLNDAVTITYHDGGDVWSYKLHFKYVGHPETLIMVDQNGFDWKYSTTDLDNALALLATKKIKDY